MRREVFVIEFKGRAFGVDGFGGLADFEEDVAEVRLVFAARRFERDGAAEVVVRFRVTAQAHTRERASIKRVSVFRVGGEFFSRFGFGAFGSRLRRAESLDVRARRRRRGLRLPGRHGWHADTESQ